MGGQRDKFRQFVADKLFDQFYMWARQQRFLREGVVRFLLSKYKINATCCGFELDNFTAGMLSYTALSIEL